MDRKEILNRLSPHSIGILKRLNPELEDIKIIPAGDAISLVSKDSKIISKLFKNLKITSKTKKRIAISDWILNAYNEAYISDSKTVEVSHLVLALLLDINKSKYYQAKKLLPAMTEDQSSKVFDKYVDDYSELIKTNKKPFIGRKRELTRLIINLSTSGGKPTLLLGDAGAGKTSLMMELMRNISAGNVPHQLQNSRILRIKLASLINNISLDGGVIPSGLLSNLFTTIAQNNKGIFKRTILFFDDLNYGVNFFVGIESAHTDDDILFVGAARDDNSEKFWDSSISKMWNIIMMSDQDDEEVLSILKDYNKKISKNLKIEFTDLALRKIIDTKSVDMVSEALPGGGIKVMDLLCTYKRHIVSDYSAKISDKNESIVVTDVDVEGFFDGSDLDSDSVVTTKLLDYRSLKIESDLKKEIIGQDEAISKLTSALRVSSLKLQGSSRPVGTFLFLGPTGVGKTQ
ncbi:hypothetical protein CO178_00560, partial [candidate division WWE3 bacterium CG_4_9_14_3_um_filter_34_6]